MRLRIEAQTADRRGGLRRRGWTRAPQQRANTRAQLAGTERLLEVVIRAEVEQLRALLRPALAGEHEDRCGRRRADPLADLVPRDARQLPIEDDQVGRLLGVTA